MNNVPTVDKGNLSPDELQDRLNQLRNPGKKQKDEEYGKKMKAYLERYCDTYDFDEISFKKEELPLDTDVFSQAVKKIQRIERGRQSRKKYTKKKPIQKKSAVQKKKRRKKRKSRRKVQKGGALCPLCIPAAGAVYLAYKNYSEKTVNAKRSVKRDEAYEMKKNNGKVIRKKFSQRGLKLDLNGKKQTCKNLKEAKRTFNKAVKECIQSGFTKC